MAENDFNSGPGRQGQEEPLSATAMFLRSFDSGSAPPQESPETGAAKPAEPPPSFAARPASPAGSGSGSGPGEFTQMFQAMEPRANTPAPPVPAPVAVQASNAQAPRVEPPAAPSQAPGEFTRIFVSSSALPKEPVARNTAETPAFQPAAPSPSKLKGFSTP